MWRCLRVPMFSHFNRTPTCDRQTDGRTDGHTTMVYTAQSRARAVKMLATYASSVYCMCTLFFVVLQCFLFVEVFNSFRIAQKLLGEIGVG